MKYTIEGFDQQQLVNWNLDTNDALILRWFVDFYHSGKMAKIEHEGETYLWVNYQACIDSLPIMRINNKQVIARHFKRLVSCGLMKSYLSKDGGVYTCFKLVETEYSKLIEKQTSSQRVDSKVDRSQLKSQEGIDSKVETKDYSIKDSSINKKTYNGEIKEIVEYLNDKACTNYKHTTSKTISLITARLNEGFTIEDFKVVIDKKVEDWADDEQWSKFLRPETLFGTKFEGYLNQKDRHQVTTTSLPYFN